MGWGEKKIIQYKYIFEDFDNLKDFFYKKVAYTCLKWKLKLQTYNTQVKNKHTIHDNFLKVLNKLILIIYIYIL